MRLLHSLVFLISAGKNPSLAFMPFALQWKKDPKRNSKTHSGGIPLHPLLLSSWPEGPLPPGPPQTCSAITCRAASFPGSGSAEPNAHWGWEKKSLEDRVPGSSGWLCPPSPI